VFVGSGLGIILRYGGTTGGVDIIARIVHKYIGWSIGKTMFLFEFFVITISLFVILDLKEGMYTLVAVFVAARIIDFIQEGAYTAKGAIIISNKSDEITEIIMKDKNDRITNFKYKSSYIKV